MLKIWEVQINIAVLILISVMNDLIRLLVLQCHEDEYKTFHVSLIQLYLCLSKFSFLKDMQFGKLPKKRETQDLNKLD